MAAERHDTPPVIYTAGLSGPWEPDPDLVAQEAALVGAVERRLLAAPSLPAALEALFDEAAPVLGADRLGLAFLDERAGRLVSRHVVARYRPLRLREGYAADVAGSSLGAVIERGVPRLIGDLEQYLVENPASASSRLAVAEGIRSSMTCPLDHEGRVIGVLFLSSRQPWAFGEREVRLLQAVSGRLARVIERAWHQDRLDAANRAYLGVLAFVSGDLEGPISGLASDARLLRSGRLGPVSEAQGRRLEAMAGRAERVLERLGGLRDLARVEQADRPLDPVEIADVAAAILEPALEAVQRQVTARGQRIVRAIPPAPVRVRGDLALLRTAAIHLLSNASTYGATGGEIRVTLELEGREVSIGVWNEGPGFPEALRERLFQRFSRLDRPGWPREAGAGIGLYTVARIVHLHGGRTTARSEEGRSAEFTVRLPAPA